MSNRPGLNWEAPEVLDEQGRSRFEQAISHTTEFPAQATIVRADTPQGESKLLLKGHVCQCKYLADGQRQIVGLPIAGDFIDLHSFLLQKLDHDIVALTPIRVASLPHAALTRIITSDPQLTRMLWLYTLRDMAIHREWILSLGQRPAVGRVAHLFCEMFMRNRAVGLVEGSSFPLPLTQIELGEACGMTSVHTNRMLQQLRREKLVEVAGKRVHILDWDRLAEIAEFDPAYLYLEQIWGGSDVMMQSKNIGPHAHGTGH
jgi:CRP-like cAMP-binding protein